jgi:cytochrome c oxidase cbb3-type subunit 1
VGANLVALQELQNSVVRFSLFWLATANLVGVLLAFLLVCPRAGEWLGEFSYGRWVALHLNWQLYGWCSLPAVGALLKRFLRPTPAGLEQARGALWAWSLALALGGLSWLEGQTSGKLFLDWIGLARILFVFAMVFLWSVLGWNFWQGKRILIRSGVRNGWIADIALLAALAAVPGSLYWSSGRGIYPSIDPGTGGPTGASLLASTLGIVLIAGLIPWMLGVPGNPGIRWKPFWLCFACEAVVCAIVSHGNSSHFDWRQAGALASLAIWVPMLGMYWRRFAWNSESILWLRATQIWWGLLVITGILAFLPGVLDRIKFTHVLVAHSHLAMAGFLTNMNMLILSNLSNLPGKAVRSISNPVPFYAWQASLALHLACLVTIGWAESVNPELWFTGGLTGLLWARLGAGILMAAVSIHWAAGAQNICGLQPGSRTY